jgi:hypothetical protein
MLAPHESEWLREEAQETFGLTPTRARLLPAVLEREQFTLREIARATQQSPESVRGGLELFSAREILEVRLVGARRGPLSAYEAVPARRLTFIFDALRLMQGATPDAKVSL